MLLGLSIEDEVFSVCPRFQEMYKFSGSIGMTTTLEVIDLIIGLYLRLISALISFNSFGVSAILRVRPDVFTETTGENFLLISWLILNSSVPEIDFEAIISDFEIVIVSYIVSIKNLTD